MNRLNSGDVLIGFVKNLWPARLQVDAGERWCALLGGGLGVLLTALLCRGWASPDLAHHPWLVAPLGARIPFTHRYCDKAAFRI